MFLHFTIAFAPLTYYLWHVSCPFEQTHDALVDTPWSNLGHRGMSKKRVPAGDGRNLKCVYHPIDAGVRSNATVPAFFMVLH